MGSLTLPSRIGSGLPLFRLCQQAQFVSHNTSVFLCVWACWVIPEHWGEGVDLRVLCVYLLVYHMYSSPFGWRIKVLTGPFTFVPSTSCRSKHCSNSAGWSTVSWIQVAELRLENLKAYTQSERWDCQVSRYCVHLRSYLGSGIQDAGPGSSGVDAGPWSCLTNLWFSYFYRMREGGGVNLRACGHAADPYI